MQHAFSTETIMPDNGCSPVVSIQVKFSPKSLNTVLYRVNMITKIGSCKFAPKQSTSIRGDKVHGIAMCPRVDLQLLGEWTPC